MSWMEGRAGRTEEVPRPWIPVKVKGDVLACWGRTQSFDGRPLPTQMTSQSQELLARPMGLKVGIEGKDARWRQCQVSPVERHGKGKYAVRTARGRLDKLLLSSRVTLHYDGALRVDVTVEPLEPVTVESLTLEIPVKKSIAEFIFADFAGVRAKTLPEEGCSGAWCPLVWMGNDDVGLGWGCDSDETWDEGEGALGLIRRGAATVLSLNVIRRPRHIDSPLAFSFGLQANPWRPIEKNAHQYRNVHLNWCYDLSEADLRDWHRKGARTVIFHSAWADLHAYPETKYAKQLQDLVRRCHRVGLKLLPYFGVELSEGAPEWPVWSENWRKIRDGRQKHGYVPYRPPYIPAFHVCPASGWQDFIVEGIEHVMKRYGVDGVYLDGLQEWTSGCSNGLHGCGYVGADGVRRRTRPIWQDRELMERIYVAVRSVKSDGRISLHANPGPLCFTGPFGTDCFGGEQYGGDFKQAALDQVRAFHVGAPQWGVPSELIAYTNDGAAVAIGLLHGVLPRAGTRKEFRNALITGVWTVQDAFGVRRADWLPYWKTRSLVRKRPAGIEVSLWNRPGQGLLAAIANLNNDDLEACVSFAAGRLGYEGATLEALDMLPCEGATELRGATVRTPAPAGQCRLLFLAPSGSALWPKMRRTAKRISLNRDLQIQVDRWLMCGPFASVKLSPGRKPGTDVPDTYDGMEVAHIPEPGVDASKTTPAGPWRKVTAKGHEAVVRPDVAADDWCVVYACTRLQFPHLVPLKEKNPVDLHFQVFHAMRVWLNGEQVYTHGGKGTPRYGQGRHDPVRVPGVLHPGWNDLLVKVVIRRGAKFFFKVTEPGSDEPHPLVKIAAEEG